jgi:Lipase (class 3)
MVFTPGFDLQDATNLLALSAIAENEPIDPALNPPPGWGHAPLFTSPPIGPFENLWQLWRRDDGAFAIAIRGTIPTAESILEDVVSLMIAAKGTLKVGPLGFDYNFSNDPLAGVHLGFALGALLLLRDATNGILVQLPLHGVTPGSAVYITGHSQGAAIATLLRSYLAYGADVPQSLNYKTYVFAQPKPGNDHYAEDFENAFSTPGMAFRVTNSLDWVPQAPFTFEFIEDINIPNPLSVALTRPLLIDMLDDLFKDMRKIIELHARAHLQTTVNALARTTPPSSVATPDVLTLGFDVPILASFNFVNAGTEAALIGTPCVGPQCRDAFFEHHASTYYKLLTTQMPAI